MEHLSSDQLAKFRGAALTGAELLAADDHLTACAACRERLQAMAAGVESWMELNHGLRATAAAEGSHISFDSLRAYVDGNASRADRMRLESHLSECPDCRKEAGDLKEFAAQLRKADARSTSHKRYLILGPIAAVLLVGVLLMRPHLPPAARMAVALQDAGRTIGLDQDGHLVGAPAGVQNDMLLAALRDGRITVNVPAGLPGSPSVLLGGDTAQNHFRVLSPVAEPVLTDAPEFHWEALDGARAYRVQVFDPDYKLVASSPELAATSWTPDRPLERGKRYAWQVTAIRGASRVTAPQPPDPEARFEVVGAAEAGAIGQARQAPASHLVLAMRYAHAGLCRDALAEIDALQAENAGSPLVRQMRDGIAGQCESQPQR